MNLFIARKPAIPQDGSRRLVAVLVHEPEAGRADVDPDLAAADGLGVYDATTALLRAAAAGRRQRQADDMLLTALREALAGGAP